MLLLLFNLALDTFVDSFSISIPFRTREFISLFFMHTDAERKYAAKAARIRRASREKINLLYSIFSNY